jgi:5-methylcytosine-specific restriction enzyme subunit McrC
VRVVALNEHTRKAVELSSTEASRLASVAGNRLLVAAATQQSFYELRATQHVGSLVVGDLTVHVRPKVRVENVLYLLGASPGLIHWWRDRFAYDRHLDLVPALVAFFARVLERDLASGLIRSYRRQEERLRTLRGRIDFAAQLSRPAIVTPIACAYEDYTADVDLNRFLKAAVRRALMIPGVDHLTRRLLNRELLRFEEVADVGVRVDLLDRHVFTRLDERYQDGWRLARLLLGGQAITDQQGKVSAQAFMVDMNRVFEAFIEDQLQVTMRGTLEVQGQAGRHLDEDGQVAIVPDLTFGPMHRPAYVADVKYKLNESGVGRNSDYYQVLAYATALSLPEALLIYCHDAGGAPPVEVVVRGSRTRLVTHRLSLAGSIADIDVAVRQLGQLIVDRTGRRPVTSVMRRTPQVPSEAIRPAETSVDASWCSSAGFAFRREAVR